MTNHIPKHFHSQLYTIIRQPATTIPPQSSYFIYIHSIWLLCGLPKSADDSNRDNNSSDIYGPQVSRMNHMKIPLKIPGLLVYVYR